MKLVEEFNTQTKDLKFGEIMVRINSHQVVLGNWSYLSASFFFFFCSPSLKVWVARIDDLGSYLDCHCEISQQERGFGVPGRRWAGKGGCYRHALRERSRFFLALLLNSALTSSWNGAGQLQKNCWLSWAQLQWGWLWRPLNNDSKAGNWVFQDPSLYLWPLLAKAPFLVWGQNMTTKPL